MIKMVLTLKEWFKAYLKYKDVVRRNVDRIEDEGDSKVLVFHRDGSTKKYYCYNALDDNSKSVGIGERVICLNTKQNFDYLLKNWDFFREKKTVFLFANPERNESWGVNAYMHSSISDKSSLKQGLKSLFESVPEIKG